MNLWGRLGMSVAFSGFFCMFMTTALQTTAYYEKFRWHFCATLGTCGLILFLTGRAGNARRRAMQKPPRKDPDNAYDEDDAPEARFFLADLAYWGAMFLAFGGLTVFIIPHPKQVQAAVIVPAAKPPVRPKPVAVMQPASTNPPAPVIRALPRLIVQGVTYAKDNPSVLINGKTLHQGDHILEATIRAINPYGAIVEFDGRFETLVIGK